MTTSTPTSTPTTITPGRESPQPPSAARAALKPKVISEVFHQGHFLV
jgi:hypothetical protein